MQDDFLKIQMANPDTFSSYKEHVEAVEYQGCEYVYRGDKYVQRSSKVTPKKIGQFVTLWKRNAEGVTIPFEVTDDFLFVVVVTHYNRHCGHFLFSKDVLIEKGILTASKEGKRGFRVYPVWDKPTSKQAVQTQKWQLQYFSPGLNLSL